VPHGTFDWALLHHTCSVWLQGGAITITISSSQVLLVQTTAVLNTPDHYAGSIFIHHCYDSFYHNASTVNCDQCLAGKYKSFAFNPDALACTDCPEVLYLYSQCTVLTMYCTHNHRAGTATPLSPRPDAYTAGSAQPGTTDQALAQLSAPLVQQVGTGNSPARRA
jgi:hypothetical protein